MAQDLRKFPSLSDLSEDTFKLLTLLCSPEAKGLFDLGRRERMAKIWIEGDKKRFLSQNETIDVNRYLKDN